MQCATQSTADPKRAQVAAMGEATDGVVGVQQQYGRIHGLRAQRNQFAYNHFRTFMAYMLNPVLRPPARLLRRSCAFDHNRLSRCGSMSGKG